MLPHSGSPSLLSFNYLTLYIIILKMLMEFFEFVKKSVKLARILQYIKILS